MNPFKVLSIYTNEFVQKYSGRRITENPPHIYAIAEAAVANVRNFKQNQAIIISGTILQLYIYIKHILMLFQVSLVPARPNLRRSSCSM